jgi:hypothetical protein
VTDIADQKMYEYGFETPALHAGQDVDPHTTARAVPIYRPAEVHRRYAGLRPSLGRARVHRRHTLRPRPSTDWSVRESER